MLFYLPEIAAIMKVERISAENLLTDLLSASPSLAPNPALARVTQNASFPIFQIAFVLKIEGGNFSTSPRIHVQNWNGIFQRQDLRREMILNVSSNF